MQFAGRETGRGGLRDTPVELGSEAFLHARTAHTPAAVLALQRTAGNAAVTAMLARNVAAPVETQGSEAAAEAAEARILNGQYPRTLIELQRTTLPSGRIGYSIASEAPTPAVTEPSTPQVTTPAPPDLSGNPANADPPPRARATPASTSDSTSAASSKPKTRRPATTRGKRSTPPTKPNGSRKPSTAVDADADTSTAPAPSDETP